MADRVLPAVLTSNPAFKDDVQRFLEVDPAQLQALRLKTGRDKEVSEQDLEEIRNLLGVKREIAGRFVYMLNYFLSRLISTGRSVDDLLSEFEEVLGSKLEEEKRSALQTALSPTSDEQRFEAGISAFAFGATYLGSSLVPVFAFGIDDQADQLFPGFSWSITYQSADGTRSSVSIHASSPEIRQLGESMLKAADDVERKLAKLGRQR